MLGWMSLKVQGVAQAFWNRNEPYGKAVEIVHGTSGLEQFAEMLGTLQVVSFLVNEILRRGGLQHSVLLKAILLKNYMKVLDSKKDL